MFARTLRLASLMILPALLMGCEAVVLNPSGDVAAQQRDLIVVSTVLMLIVVVPVMVMTVWFALSVVGILALIDSPLPLVWTALALWVIAWGVQFYGHEVEGAKPSFADDLVFLLIGPLFVMEKLYRKFR
mgnify:CR=1 FL=1